MQKFTEFFTFLILLVCLLSFPSKNLAGQPLSGSYTVDTTGGGDFKSISAAAQALNQKGVNGPVTINIKPGIYNEGIKIDSIEGTSQQNTVTFQSSTQDSSDVEVFQKEKNDKAVVFKLTKTDHITFRDLNVAVKSSEYSGIFHAFNVENGVTHLTIKNCNIKITPKGNENDCINIMVDYQESSIKEIIVDNNIISGGGIFVDGEFNSLIQGITVKNNEIFAENGVSCWYSKNTIIKNNKLSTNSKSSTSGVKILYPSKIDIIKNKISGYEEGLRLVESDDFKAKALIVNNFINASRYGIYNNKYSNFDGEFYYNSVNITNNGNMRRSLAVTFTHNSIYKNNIFANENGQVLATSDTSSFIADHNNFFTNAKDFGIIRKRGFNNNDTISNFGKYKQKFNEGQNSHQIKPGFVSDSDLHATNNNLKGEATPVSKITEDIDGDQRDAQHPDIGADEIIAVPDLVVTSGSIQPQSLETDGSFKVNWTVKNKGGITAKSNWEDRIYLSRDRELDKQTDHLLGKQIIYSDLKPLNTYKKEQGFAFPYADSTGKFYILVNTNDTGTIDDYSNNLHVVNKLLDVTLSDRPELKITQIKVPQNVNSGEKFKFSYTVKNSGKEQTEGSWKDQFYIGSNKSALQNQLVPADSLTLIKENKQAPVSLKPGQSYQASITTRFPLRFSGQYYVKGYTDINDDIPETNEGKDNSFVSPGFQVNQTPLPDLRITKINVDGKYFSGGMARFNYTIQNTGTDTVDPYPWLDKVWLTNDGTHKILGTIGQVNSLHPGEQMKVFDSFKMPNCESDSFWLQIKTDHGEDVTELTEANNFALSDTFKLVLKPKPDLIVNNVKMLTNNPTTEQSGVRVEVTVKNDGNIDYTYGADGFLYNGIYLSKDKDLNVKKDRLLNLESMKKDIPAGSQKKAVIVFRMPADVPGKYYVFAYTDKSDQVCELPFEDNNTGHTASKINIQLAPPKDLSPVSWTFQTQDRKTGEQINLTATIQNKGPGKISNYQWNDAIYLIDDQDKDSTLLKTQYQNLAPKDSGQYKLRKSINIPVNLSEGQYYLSVITDYQYDVYEHKAEDNNALNSGLFKITRDSNAVSDLVAESISLKNSPKSGQILKFNYTVKNDSKEDIQLSGWENKVTLKNSSGRVVATNTLLHLGQLAGNQTVQASGEINIPEGKSGKYKLVLKLDGNNKIYEYNHSNNKIEKSITIKLSPYADLDGKITGIPSKARSGQRLPVDYTISNKGTGKVKNQGWIDRLYLSKDQILDKNDVRIATIRHQKQNLGVSSSMNSKADTFLPVNINGYYYVILKTDAGGQIYEHNNTTNNLHVSSNQVKVNQALPADLAVNNINILSRSNKSVTYEAEVINNGPNNIKGSCYYSTHISGDKVWDAGDERQSGNMTFNKLTSGNTKTIKVTVDYPVIKPGYYHLFLKLDKLNQIPETDEDNNTHLFSDSFHISFLDTLKVDKKKQDDYEKRASSSKPNYYQMDVGKDTGIYLQLNPNSSNLSTELYTKSEAIPDRLNYDHKHNNPGDANQDIIIPSQDSSRRDFIMTLSNYMPKNSVIEPYSILAESKTFSIERVYPTDGSNKGVIVMGIYGFDFEDSTKFKLISQDKTDTITPLQQVAMNSTEGRAHFDLRKHDTGLYDVYAIKKGGAKTKMDQGFKVLSEGIRDLTTAVTTPGRRLVGNKAYAKIFAGNKGKINAYDMSLNVMFYREDTSTKDLSVRFNGSDAPYEHLTVNPPGRDNFLDTMGMKFFSLYYPVVPSSSTTTFTFEMTSHSTSKVHVVAFWSDYPKTDWAFSGSVQDLASSRFVQMVDSIIAHKIGKIKNSSKKLDNCSEDLSIKNMEEEVMDELTNQVICIHPITPSAWAKRQFAEKAAKGAFSSLGIKKGDKIAKMGKDAYGDFQTAKTWKGRAPGTGDGTHYSEEVNFVFDCIKNNSKFRRSILDKNNCWERFSVKHPDPNSENGFYTETKYRNVCNNNSGSSNNDGYFTSFVNSIDPNEIIGPSGYTKLKLIKPGKTMSYDILFENKSAATSPAQQVKITNPLPPETNIKRFKLGKFGFGDTTFNLPDRQRATKRFKLGSGQDRIIVKVKAGIDPISREAFWTISTIDPETGLPPKDPSMGFLPPNDSTGRGEGFVSYQIDAKENLKHGDSITNQATIIFDDNAVIETNTWVNIIGKDQLRSKILKDYNKVDSTSVVLEWEQITQKPFSTEISGYNIYVSKNNKKYRKWLGGTPDQQGLFSGKAGETYYFISQGIGVNKQVEPFKNNYEVKVTFDSSGSDDAGMEPMPEEKMGMLNGGKQLIIYPNPAKAQTYVKFKVNTAQKLQFKLTNIQGKTITTLQNRHFLAGTYKFRFDPNKLDLEGGVYFLKMQGQSTNTVKKWIYMR